MPLENQPGADPQQQAQSVSVEDYNALKAEVTKLNQTIQGLNSRNAEAEAEAAAAEAAAAGQPPPFNYDAWAKQFVEKPDVGMDVLDEFRYGFKPREELPKLRKTVQALVWKDQAREAEVWMEQTPTYDRTPENSEALLKTMEELNLPVSRAGFDAAFNVAVKNGAIKPKEEKQQQTQQQEPPRRRGPMPTARGREAAPSSQAAYTEEQLMNMSEEELIKVAETGSIWQ